MHCIPPFGIELCSVWLLGLVVLEQHGSEHLQQWTENIKSWKKYKLATYINSTEQNSSVNVFWFSSSVTFVWAIFICDELRCKRGLYLNIALLIWAESDTDSHKSITNNLRLFILLSSCFCQLMLKSCSQSENSTHFFVGRDGGSEKFCSVQS